LVSQQVSHPHIVPVLDAQLRKPPFYLVTPRLPGTTLRTLIDRHGRLDLTTALWFARQTAQGLGALHSHHWLHADVKPENIFIAPDGHVTLIDLGFARHFQEAGTACNRRIQGTFNYIAPEMITSAYGATAGSDLYSLGATFYEMLAGQPPFQSRNLADLARAHRQQRPVCIRQLVPQISAAVADLLMGMLAKQPVRRASSTAAVVEQLVRLEIDSFARCA
jgi:serine/threonine-protein kinase